MKIAKVIPIFKCGAKEDIFSKILEKLFYKRIMSFVNSNNILSHSQYGFREQQSTSYAISELIEYISDSIDDDNISLALFIDLKKAFFLILSNNYGMK